MEWHYIIGASIIKKINIILTILLVISCASINNKKSEKFRDKQQSKITIKTQQLNIGLDSLVIVDDSSFEVELIKSKLPEVTVLQVPEKLYEYPKMIRENINLFYKDI